MMAGILPNLFLFLNYYSLLISTCLALPSAQQQTQYIFRGHEQADSTSSSRNGSIQSARWPLDMINAISVMQDEYFSIWHGTWPQAIDWTAAVLGTHLPATLATISALDIPDDERSGASSTIGNAHLREDLVNTYFSQLIAFHYGQDWFALRQQANDDMLWVVLGWLEAITFVQMHSASRHPQEPYPWYGENFIRTFAHRARIFWELASRGWDETLCGGGMIWNPRLAPYKNAITNELYIAASISMYLYFPGDDNDTPFIQDNDPKFPARDRKYLDAAVKAYDWLEDSNMTNSQGLYTDGFHISGWRGGRNPSNGTGKCDVRDEQVYTYNQGVILTGLRGLWEATHEEKYLMRGHDLIRNVILATGWKMESQQATSSRDWQGIGRLGVLEERCDILGTCSQDGQTFKGIFFMHYAAFCRPLPTRHGVSEADEESLHERHIRQCQNYSKWVQHNAKAALLTRDSKGLFSMWWTEGLWTDSSLSSLQKAKQYGPVGAAGTDYRNKGVPDDAVWRLERGSHSDETNDKNHNDKDDEKCHEKLAAIAHEKRRQLSARDRHDVSYNPLHRQRSPEIQSGGLSVVRADIWHRLHGG